MMDGAYNWAETLNKEMGELGYYRSKADPAVRSRHVNGNITITSTYTDDTMGISSSKEEAEHAKDELGWTYETKDLGDANLVLGIRIDRDRQVGQSVYHNVCTWNMSWTVLEWQIATHEECHCQPE